MKSETLAMVCLLAPLGCYKTVNVAAIEPLKTAYPVSASGQYVDESGKVVADDSYTIVKPFAFRRTADGPRHASSVTALQVQPELDRVVAQWHGDAVVDFKVQAVDYNNDSHELSSLFKGLGWTGGVVGAGIFVAGAASASDNRTAVMTGGATTLGVGVVLYLVGALINGPTQWELDVSGRVVKSAPDESQAAP